MVTRFEWDPTLSVGVRLLDEQHKQIIAMMNLLLSEPQANVRSETVSEVLSRLTAYAAEHFRAEEQLLEEHGYPDLERHRREHQQYRYQVVLLCQGAMFHDDTVPEEILRFLCDWWKNHILGTDMKYREFFAARGVR